MSWSYPKAGVDLDRHRYMHKYVLKLINDLLQELGVEVEGLGGYGTSIKIGDLKLMLHVDGVGTKTIVLERLGRLWVAGWDCLAMNVNDVVCDGGEPIALVDYIAMPSDNPDIFKEIAEGLIKAAKIARIPILGGETAILRDLVSGVDVVCTVLAIKRTGFVNKAVVGDFVIGVESWGLHANGYTLVRRIIENTVRDYGAIVEGIELGEELAKPTAIYSSMVLEAIDKGIVHGVAHITGGAFTKVKRVLDRLDIVMEMPKPPQIFEIIMKLGNVDASEMYRVFNMGIGLIMTTPLENLDPLLKVIKNHNLKAHILGKVVEGENRVKIKTYNGIDIVL
ncbi:MAG: phosphoribosylformylglycinamidine cyclo-ligase [Ignisphaera sp.]|uniref:phosphoribosylformylglycinamidine cyclo-ligase n=1 Tax=Ignisphaera aggregans TaxID=334771 RepID=A0A7J3I5Z2_9CREN